MGKRKKMDDALCSGTEVGVKSHGAIFILENASLRKGFIRKKPKILSSDEDANFLLRQGKNPNDYRPDIVYDALRAILDSPLNDHGKIEAIYVKTDSGLLFEIKPHVRIPRTLELFDKSCIHAHKTGEVLIRLLDRPVMHYIPDNSRIIGLSYSSPKLVDIEDYVAATCDNLNLVFVVGAMVHGKVSNDYTYDYISVSNYPLSAKCCLGLICEALEQKKKIHALEKGDVR